MIFKGKTSPIFSIIYSCQTEVLQKVKKLTLFPFQEVFPMQWEDPLNMIRHTAFHHEEREMILCSFQSHQYQAEDHYFASVEMRTRTCSDIYNVVPSRLVTARALTKEWKRTTSALQREMTVNPWMGKSSPYYYYYYFKKVPSQFYF